MVAPVTSSVGDSQENQEPQEDEAGAAQLAVALTPKQRTVLDLLLQPNARVPDVANKAGVHRGTVNRWLNQDENFIAAFNARLLENITIGHARMAALIPKAMQTIEDALDTGDARIAMQLIKCGLLTQRKALSLSSSVVAEERKVAEQKQRLELEKQKIELLKQEEETIAQKKEVESERFWRVHEEKPFKQRYEEERRSYYELLAEGRVHTAQKEEIDARLAAAVESEARALMNPGTQQRQPTAPPDATGKTNPGTPANSKATESPGQ